MTCPLCGSKTTVKDCRSLEDSKRRVRVCRECKHRFNTLEIDADYYESLKPITKEAIKYMVQNALLDSFADATKKVYKMLDIEAVLKKE